jgi:hypothetical protein
MVKFVGPMLAAGILAASLGPLGCGSASGDSVDGAAAAGGSGANGSAGGDGGTTACPRSNACPDGRPLDETTCECLPCVSTLACPEGSTCNVESGACEPALACTTHEGCGPAAFCGLDGVCEASLVTTPCDSDQNCLYSNHCNLGFCGCQTMRYAVNPVPPNVVIVLDRSDSMNETIGDTTKWDAAREAITGLIEEHIDAVRFGLLLYPGSDAACSMGAECEVGSVSVDPDAETTEAIHGALSEAETCAFGTPTAEALAALVTYPGLSDSQRPNYVLLLTDGMSTCADPVEQVELLRERAPEVRTFVVGFGDQVDSGELTSLAEAGGTARTEPPNYYQADDPEALRGALTAVVSRVFPCSYDFADFPIAHSAETAAYFGEEPIPRDETHVNGWDYDPSAQTVTFYGSACARLARGDLPELAIVTGCSFAQP